MADVATDTLIKPDMGAVLSRTHLASDLHGFLLPVFEAISNAMDGIESRFGDEARSKGKIEIRFQKPNDPASLLISITDNGVGLTDANYKSFKTPFSGFKLKEKGRGFGRFIAFKVFARILYSSRYAASSEEKERTFRFDIAQEQEFIYFDGTPDFPGQGLRVEYDEPLPIWHELIRDLKSDEVSDEIGSHFLPYFLHRWLPEITIQFDEGVPENITSHFKDVFVEYDSGTLECEIDEEKESLFYSLSRIPRTRLFRNHCLLFSAADRIVGAPRDLSNKLGQPYFVDDKNERYIVIAVVRGEAFETRLNDARTPTHARLPADTSENIMWLL